MKMFLSHTVLMDCTSHRIINADAEVFAWVNHDIYSPVESFVKEEEREEFLNLLNQKSHEWSHVTFAGKICYCRFDEKNGMELVAVDDLINGYIPHIHALHEARALASLYGDTLFSYDPVKDRLEFIRQTEIRFPENVYTFNQFAEILKSEDSEEDIPRFLHCVKHCDSSFRLMSDIRLSETSEGTLMQCQPVYQPDGVFTSIGRLHALKKRGNENYLNHAYDALTGLYLKNQITDLAVEMIDEKKEDDTVLAVVDIDYFKNINDTYGHQKGDDVLRQFAGILKNCVGNTGYAGRIGGDEFLLVLKNAEDETALRTLLRNLKNSVMTAFPDLNPLTSGPLTLSIGTASYPNDAENYDDLFLLADHCLYTAKEKGRNRYVIYDLDKHGTLDDIKGRNTVTGKINVRKDMTTGDLLVRFGYMRKYGKAPALSDLMNEVRESLEVDLAVLYEEGHGIIHISGTGEAEKLERLLSDERVMSWLDVESFIVVNHIDALPKAIEDMREKLEDMHIPSLILVKVKEDRILLLASIGKKIMWNQNHYPYYRLFAELLGEYE